MTANHDGKGRFRRLMTAFALLAILGSVLMVAVGAPHESDAALGDFTGGSNASSASNPYTGMDCDVSDLQSSYAFDESGWEVYYVELGSYMDLSGLDVDDEFQRPPAHGIGAYGAWSNFTLTSATGQWTGGNVRGYFTGTGDASFSVAEDYAVIIEVVCTNDTELTDVYVSGYSSTDTVTYGLYTDGTTNTKKSLTISTKPTYNASPAPTTTVRVTQTSGYGVVEWWQGISASGLVPYLYVVPESVGVAEFLIEATDGGGASRTFTVVVNEYTYSTMTFDPNGGTGGPDDIEESSATGSFYFDIPADEPVRSGYTFLGWAESPGATEPEYDYADVYDDRFGPTTSTHNTLYAVWERSTQTFTATLRYDADGGSGAPASQTASIEAVSASGSKTFTVTSSEPVRSGFVFSGWALSPSASSASYHAGDSIAVSYGSSVTLYAVWEVATISVTGTPGTHAVVGTTWSYTPTVDTAGTTLSVSGASWLTVSGSTVMGTPDTPGTHTVTLTASRTGYQPGTQTFTVTVLSALSFQSSPTGGAIIHAV